MTSATGLNDSIVLYSRRGMHVYIVGVVVVLILSCLFGCSPRRQAPAASRAEEAQPNTTEQSPAEESSTKAEFDKAQMVWTDQKGQPVWEAQFKEAVALQEGTEGTVELIVVKATLYRNGKKASSLVAPRVVADSRSREVRASGGVIVTSAADKSTARAENLVWKSREDKIVGTGAIKMVRGNITVTARKFETDTALNKTRFYDGKAMMN